MRMFFCVLASLFCCMAYGQNLNSRNLLVLRVGSGTAVLNNSATAVYLDEYTPAGGWVKTIPMPTADVGVNKKLTLSGTSAFEGYPVLSPDGQSVSLFGYNSALGTSAVSNTATGRTIAIIDPNGTVNTSTCVTDAFSGQSTGAAVYDGGNGIWMVGGNAVRYAVLGSSVSTPLSSTGGRSIAIFDEQLYMSSANGSTRLATVGPGVLPIAWQTVANLSGDPLNVSSPGQFLLVDVCNSIPGADVLYIADYNSGIQKYSLVNGTWVSNGKMGAATDQYTGITGSADNGNVQIYAIRKSGTGNAGGGELVSIADNSGYNTNIVGTPVVLATAQNNTVFRGISYGFKKQEQAMPVAMGMFSATKQKEHAKITWTTYYESQSSFFDILRSSDGKQFQPIGRVKAALNSNKEISYNYLDKNPPVGEVYYRLKQMDVDGKFVLSDIKMLRFGLKTDELKMFWLDSDITEFLVVMPKSDKATLKLYNIAGNLMGTEYFFLQQGANNVKPNAKLVQGVYIAVLNTGIERTITKFIKK